MSEFLSKTVPFGPTMHWKEFPQLFLCLPAAEQERTGPSAFWNSLAVHGMVLVSNGIRGTEELNKAIPQGNSVLGMTSMASLKDVERPTKGERHLAELQGKNFAKIAFALKIPILKKSSGC
jgi:NAD(P)H dehydrogenase (quinone)